MTLTKSGDATLTNYLLHDETLEILYKAFHGGFTTKSDIAREQATHVACAASLGLITTALPDGSFSNQWRATEAGINVLFKQYLKGAN